jgi:hypothetical protein
VCHTATNLGQAWESNAFGTLCLLSLVCLGYLGAPGHPDHVFPVVLFLFAVPLVGFVFLFGMLYT